MIRYERFTKRFGPLVAVEGLELEVRPGEVLALIGPNGSGKSTTLKSALGLVRPTEGRVLVGGVDVMAAGRAARARLGYLPQRLSFPEGCTAREVMRFYARLRGAADHDVEGLLQRVGLAEAAGRVAESYSGGMKQRLGIAVALLGQPEALVLDEPTAALDPTGSLSMRDLVAEIRAEGTTVLLSSHDLAEVAALADRVAVFLEGRLAALGTAQELKQELRLPSQLQLRFASAVVDAVAAAERAGATSVVWEGEVLRCQVAEGAEAGVLDALRDRGGTITEISIRTPELEEIYRRITAPLGRRVA